MNENRFSGVMNQGSIYQLDGRVWVWRIHGEVVLFSECIVPTVKFGGGRIMVWEGFLWTGTLDLNSKLIYENRGGMDASQFISSSLTIIGRHENRFPDWSKNPHDAGENLPYTKTIDKRAPRSACKREEGSGER
ncbi:hypothetical protein TNCV_2956641 [Trichonephila clavipes]|nr:hypothetical protein TNCV_2956641 [Trichonephila clavipes]